MAYRDKEGRMSAPIRGKRETDATFETRRQHFLKATNLTEWMPEEEEQWKKEQNQMTE